MQAARRASQYPTAVSPHDQKEADTLPKIEQALANGALAFSRPGCSSLAYAEGTVWRDSETNHLWRFGKSKLDEELGLQLENLDNGALFCVEHADSIGEGSGDLEKFKARPKALEVDRNSTDCSSHADAAADSVPSSSRLIKGVIHWDASQGLSSSIRISGDSIRTFDSSEFDNTDPDNQLELNENFLPSSLNIETAGGTMRLSHEPLYLMPKKFNGNPSVSAQIYEPNGDLITLREEDVLRHVEVQHCPGRGVRSSKIREWDPWTGLCTDIIIPKTSNSTSSLGLLDGDSESDSEVLNLGEEAAASAVTLAGNKPIDGTTKQQLVTVASEPAVEFETEDYDKLTKPEHPPTNSAGEDAENISNMEMCVTVDSTIRAEVVLDSEATEVSFESNSGENDSNGEADTQLGSLSTVRRKNYATGKFETLLRIDDLRELHECQLGEGAQGGVYRAWITPTGRKTFGYNYLEAEPLPGPDADVLVACKIEMLRGDAAVYSAKQQTHSEYCQLRYMDLTRRFQREMRQNGLLRVYGKILVDARGEFEGYEKAKASQQPNASIPEGEAQDKLKEEPQAGGGTPKGPGENMDAAAEETPEVKKELEPIFYKLTVMEIAPKGAVNMRDILFKHKDESDPRNLSFCAMKQIFVNLMRCMHRLERLELLHLDIKPDNFLVDLKTNQVYLIDYDSLCTAMQYQELDSCSRFAPKTPAYCPPERHGFADVNRRISAGTEFLRGVTDNRVITSGDLWPLGLMAIEFFFDAAFALELMHMMLDVSASSGIWTSVVPTREEYQAGRVDFCSGRSNVERVTANFNPAVVDPQRHVETGVRAGIARMKHRLVQKLIVSEVLEIDEKIAVALLNNRPVRENKTTQENLVRFVIERYSSFQYYSECGKLRCEFT